MCGFFGELAFKNQSDLTLLNSITKLSGLRGPDNFSFIQKEDLYLGFNRLAILDRSSQGMQPMRSPSGRYLIVYNGEIYNHNELRRTIKESFHGTSDTETLVYALDKYGINQTVELIDGMFAIAIWDKLEKILSLVRDFAGIKPLFYGKCSNGIVFSSQYDQILVHPWFRNNSINSEVLKLYLSQQYMPPPFGIVNDTFQVKPGEIVSISREGKFQKQNYWNFPEPGPDYISDKNDALESIDEYLDVSVRNEMISDVPLGTFLSGGIDSPLVTYYAHKQNADIKSFTIGSDSTKHDESEDAAWYANAIGIDHRLHQTSSNSIMDYWESIMTSLHEPLADISIIPTFNVSNWAKKEVTVALSGDGGDELFFGYERFGSIVKNTKYHKGPYFLRYLLYGIDRIYSGNRNINGTILYSNQAKAHQSLHSRFSNRDISSVFNQLAEINIPTEFDTYKYTHEYKKVDVLNQMRKAEFYGMMQKTLRKVDLASMENSLEVRVPFLSKQMIELSVQIDSKLSVTKKDNKRILKDLLLSKLPDAPISSQKRGFSIPLSRWIKESAKEPILDVLNSDKSRNQFGIDKISLNRIINDHLSDKIDNKWPIFTIYALLKWHQNAKNAQSKCLTYSI